MHKSSIPIALTILLPILAGACGSGHESQPAADRRPDSAASTASRDACSLITAEEAGKILGSPAKPTPRSTSAERSTCDYVTDGFESFTLEAVWKGAEGELASARSAARLATSQAGGQDQVVNSVIGLQRVENLGDKAYFSRRTRSYVRKGDALLAFENAGLNEPAREHWEALARAALKKL
ncbi:MAG: hypothetical protein H0W08_09220 [Acidobacteria bacterium]|nr:hypothetical protein [Acidobacteriota bacterium]